MPRDPLDELIEDLEKALPPPTWNHPQPFEEVIALVEDALEGFYRRPRPEQVAPEDTRDDPKATEK